MRSFICRLNSEGSVLWGGSLLSWLGCPTPQRCKIKCLQGPEGMLVSLTRFWELGGNSGQMLNTDPAQESNFQTVQVYG